MKRQMTEQERKKKEEHLNRVMKHPFSTPNDVVPLIIELYMNEIKDDNG